MAITRTPMIDDDGSGTTGTIINNAWKQELYNQIDAMPDVGAVWQDAPLGSVTFSALSGTWTMPAGFQWVFKYQVNPATRTVSLYFNIGSSAGVVLSAATQVLYMTIAVLPVSAAGAGGFVLPSMPYWIASGVGAGVLGIGNNSQQLQITRDIPATAFPAQNALMYLQGQGFYVY